jgi:hypothetical protein
MVSERLSFWGVGREVPTILFVKGIPMSEGCKDLQVGQTVILEQQESAAHIIAVPAADAPHTVVEIGADYVVFDNPTAGVTTRVPTHFLKTRSSAAPAPQAA